MIDLELQLLKHKPARLSVLRAYQAAADALGETHAVGPQPRADCPKVERSTDDESAEESDEMLTEGEDSVDLPKQRTAKWLARIAVVDGVEPRELSKIHGQLIAYGLLKCDLADRSSGMVYQVTATARQVLAKLANQSADDSHAASEAGSIDEIEVAA